MSRSAKLGINCGSGQRRFKTTPEIRWTNIDSQWKEGHEPDIQCDGAHLTMYEDGEVDYFVLHHVLEHFGCGEGTNLIKEAHRVLRPGGSLLVFVPDLRALADRWLRGGLDTQIYVTNLYGAYMGSEDDRHKWGYDQSSLYSFLRSCANWMSVGPYVSRELPGSDIAQDFWILGMECIK